MNIVFVKCMRIHFFFLIPIQNICFYLTLGLLKKINARQSGPINQKNPYTHLKTRRWVKSLTLMDSLILKSNMYIS